MSATNCRATITCTSAHSLELTDDALEARYSLLFCFVPFVCMPNLCGTPKHVFLFFSEKLNVLQMITLRQLHLHAQFKTLHTVRQTFVMDLKTAWIMKT